MPKPHCPVCDRYYALQAAHNDRSRLASGAHAVLAPFATHARALGGDRVCAHCAEQILHHKITFDDYEYGQTYAFVQHRSRWVKARPKSSRARGASTFFMPPLTLFALYSPFNRIIFRHGLYIQILR